MNQFFYFASKSRPSFNAIIKLGRARTFFNITLTLYVWKKKVTYTYGLRVSKSWGNLHSWVNYLFKNFKNSTHLTVGGLQSCKKYTKLHTDAYKIHLTNINKICILFYGCLDILQKNKMLCSFMINIFKKYFYYILEIIISVIRENCGDIIV